MQTSCIFQLTVHCVQIQNIFIVAKAI